MEIEKELTAKIVDEIINDLEDRKGLNDEWWAIDSDIKAEIKATWKAILDRFCVREHQYGTFMDGKACYECFREKK